MITQGLAICCHDSNCVDNHPHRGVRFKRQRQREEKQYGGGGAVGGEGGGGGEGVGGEGGGGEGGGGEGGGFEGGGGEDGGEGGGVDGGDEGGGGEGGGGKGRVGEGGGHGGGGDGGVEGGGGEGGGGEGGGGEGGDEGGSGKGGGVKGTGGQGGIDYNVLAANDDPELGVDEKAMALRCREKIEEKLHSHGGALRFRFSIQRDRKNKEKWIAVCECGLTNSAQEGKNFLKNFMNQHLLRLKCSSVATPAGKAASSSASFATPAGTAASSSASFATPAGTAASSSARPELSSADLEELAHRDALDMPALLREAADRVRRQAQLELENGAFAHPFCIVGIGEADNREWRVVCGACKVENSFGIAVGSGSPEYPYLYNFWRQHLIGPLHTAAARLRHEAFQAARDDAALDAEAKESAARAAAGVATSSGATRAQFAPQVEEPTELELLVGLSPALAWVEDEAGQRIGVRCSWCRLMPPFKRSVDDSRLLHDIQTHLTTTGKNSHRESASYAGRTIAAMFGGNVKGPTPPPLPPPDLTTFCWGFHMNRVQYGNKSYDVKEMLNSVAVDASSAWVPEPHVQHVLRRTATSGNGNELVQIEGTFRATGSKPCKRSCLSADGRRLPNLMCDSCRAIPKLKTFEMHVRRFTKAKRRGFNSRAGVNFRYMPRPRLIDVCREQSGKIDKLKRAFWLLRQSFLRKCTRVRQMVGRLEENATRGNVKALVDDLIYCERQGKFAQRQPLFNFIRDLIHCLRLSSVQRQSRQMRWSKSTKRIFGVLRKFGGARTHRFLHETLQAPDIRTVEREWARDKMRFTPGVHRELFEKVGLFYRDAKKMRGISGKVLYELSEDETTVPGASQYNQHLDSIVGFCGKRGPTHMCDECCSVVIGDKDDAYEIIEGAWRDYQLAGYLRLMVVNPLHEGLPALAVLAHATCNRFDAAWVRDQWRRTDALADELISPHLGERLGRASDGDARRYKEQIADMNELPTAQGRFGLVVASFRLSARRLPCGAITDCHSQDPLHNLSKLMCNIDLASRRVQWGRFTATHSFIRRVAEGAEAFSFEEHQLGAAEINRVDRQHKRSAANLCSRSVQVCMEKLIDGDAKRRPQEQMRGTLSFIKMVSRYLRLFLGTKDSLYERVKHAGFITGLLRRARQYVHHRADCTLKEHFLPRQTYTHVLLSVHSAVLIILAQGERSPEQPVCLRKSGTQCCERKFAELGPFGVRACNVRNFTVADALEGLGDINTLALYQYDPDCELKFGHRNRALEIDMTGHEDLSAAPADLKQHLSAAEYAKAWTEGDDESKVEAEQMGMKPEGRTPAWWDEPWRGEPDQVAAMRIADDDELGGEASSEGLDDECRVVNQATIQPDPEAPGVQIHLAKEYAVADGDGGGTDLKAPEAETDEEAAEEAAKSEADAEADLADLSGDVSSDEREMDVVEGEEPTTFLAASAIHAPTSIDDPTRAPARAPATVEAPTGTLATTNDPASGEVTIAIPASVHTADAADAADAALASISATAIPTTASNVVEADLNDVLDPPPAPITTSEVKRLAGIYMFVKGDGSCPYYAVLACVRELEHASTEAEQTPTVGDLRRVEQMRRHNVEWLRNPAQLDFLAAEDVALCSLAELLKGPKYESGVLKEMGTYGTTVDLCAIAALFNVDIVSFNRKQPNERRPIICFASDRKSRKGRKRASRSEPTSILEIEQRLRKPTAVPLLFVEWNGHRDSRGHYSAYVPVKRLECWAPPAWLAAMPRQQREQRLAHAAPSGSKAAGRGFGGGPEDDSSTGNCDEEKLSSVGSDNSDSDDSEREPDNGLGSKDVAHIQSPWLPAEIGKRPSWADVLTVRELEESIHRLAEDIHTAEGANIDTADVSGLEACNAHDGSGGEGSEPMVDESDAVATLAVESEASAASAGAGASDTANAAKPEKKNRTGGGGKRRAHAVRASPKLKLPGGRGFAYKRTVVAEFNRIKQGDRLSRDRLERIRTAAQVEAKRGSADAEMSTKNVLQVGDDFAMAFEDAGKHVAWIGRCNQLYRKRQRGALVELREPVCLDDLPTDVMVSASWYGCKDESRCVYEFDAAIDRKLWSLEHYIGSPCLEYNANSRLFHLANPTETLAALDAAVQQTAPAKPGAKRTRGEEAEILEKKRQRQSAQWDERSVGVSTGNERAARASRMSASSRLGSSS